MADDWKTVQSRAFTRWVNWALSKRGVEVTDLKKDLSTGVLLAALLEEVSGSKVVVPFPDATTNNIHKLQNINECLKFLRRNGVRMVNVGASDIMHGNDRIVLGLVWMIISKWILR